MKQKQSLLVGLFTAAVLAVSAQKSKAPQQAFSRDLLKINTFSLPLKNVSLQYEYVLNKKLSLALGLRVMPTTAVPFEGVLDKAFANNDVNTKDLINTSRLGNAAVTPELRYYFGKGFGRGFYAAPYYRFSHFTSNTLIVNYSMPGGPKRSLVMNGEMSAHSGGILLGAQWLLGKHLVLDWWLAGAHYGASRGHFSGNPATEFSAGEEAAVKQAIDDLEVPTIKKTVSTSAKSVEVKTNGAYGGVRAGLCVGVRF